jgi:hypothetical protein
MSQEFRQVRRSLVAMAASLLPFIGAANAAGADFVTAVRSTHPIAYFRLNTIEGKSVVGSTQYRSNGGISLAGPGAPVGVGSQFVRFHGKDGYIVTTQSGGINGAASMMAWVNLAALPSDANRIFYVMGESQNGNDLDLQFDTDNQLKFYTAAGGHVTFAPPPDTLLNQWHLVIATLDTPTRTRTIFWDGNAVATDKGSGAANKSGIFSIGESTVFRGRFFKGGIQEVALWNRALRASEVAAIYAATSPTSGDAIGSTQMAPLAGAAADREYRVPSESSRYLGCYKDTDLRDLNEKHWEDGQMTQDRCIESCRENGFAYAGIQYGSQCYCGNSYGRFGQIAENNCNTSCGGDSGRNCGGTWANSVFKTSNRPMPSAPSHATSSATYLGCYKDTDLRDLNEKHWEDRQMTQDRCINSCGEDGLAYAGVQYGGHCFCGNSFGRYGKIAENNCKTPCSGDSGQNCGGTWANSVFRVR